MPAEPAGAEAAIRAQFPEGVHAAINCAGKEQSLDACIRSVRSGGTIAVPAVHAEQPSVNVWWLTRNSLTVVGSLGYTRETWERTIALVSSGRFDIAALRPTLIERERIIEDGFESLGRQADTKVLVRVGGEAVTVPAYRFAASACTTIHSDFATDLRDYAEAGMDGIGLWEEKLPRGHDGRSVKQLRESGLTATFCFPEVPSVLPGDTLFAQPRDPAARIARMCEGIRRLAAFEPVAVACYADRPPRWRPARRTAGWWRASPVAAEAARESGTRLALEVLRPSAERQSRLHRCRGDRPHRRVGGREHRRLRRHLARVVGRRVRR